MEAISTLIGLPPPPPPPHFSSLSTTKHRRLSFITHAEPGDDAKERSGSVEIPVSSSPPKKAALSGAGFGGVGEDNGKKRRGKEKGSVIRRSPVERPAQLYQASGSDGASKEQQSVNEGAFLLTWLVLGFLILVEGLALAASGFLPEEWDSFFVKYLYPSFTPTVFFFVSGTVVYGVLKYLQAEKMKS